MRFGSFFFLFGGKADAKSPSESVPITRSRRFPDSKVHWTNTTLVLHWYFTPHFPYFILSSLKSLFTLKDSSILNVRKFIWKSAHLIGRHFCSEIYNFGTTVAGVPVAECPISYRLYATVLLICSLVLFVWSKCSIFIGLEKSANQNCQYSPPNKKTYAPAVWICHVFAMLNVDKSRVSPSINIILKKFFKKFLNEFLWSMVILFRWEF